MKFRKISVTKFKILNTALHFAESDESHGLCSFLLPYILQVVFTLVFVALACEVPILSVNASF